MLYNQLMAGTTTYSQEIADRICDEIANGSNLNRLCESDDFPTQQTVFNWFKQQPAFFENYAHARSLRAGVRSDRIDGYLQQVLSGKLDANSARVIIDAEKWQAGKENPKVYGDKVQQEVSGAGGGPVVLNILPVKTDDSK